MPLLHLTYSANAGICDARALLQRINAALVQDASIVDASDVKSWASAVDDFCVGVQADGTHGFIHARLALWPGRSAEQERALMDAIVGVIHDTVTPPPAVLVQVSAEVAHIQRQTYYRATLQDGPCTLPSAPGHPCNDPQPKRPS